MRKRTSDYYSSDTDQMVATEDIGVKAPVVDDYQDIFVMRPQTHSNYGDSFREAKRLYDNGNEEVRKLLLKECSLIYECRKCRNMFRSLTQFIGHKRVFCRSKVHSDDDNTEGDNYNGFSSNHVMAAKEICSKKNRSSDCVLQKIDEAVQPTRKLSESNELMDEKIMAGESTEQMVDHTGNEKLKNIIACPQELCKLSFSNTKELEIHFSQDHTKTTLLTPPAEQVAPEHTVITRAKRILSTNCHKCEHCGKVFELKEALSTHLLHCPVKHNILSKTLSAGISDQSVTKRQKLQASTDGTTTELHPSAEACKNDNTEKAIEKVPAVAGSIAVADSDRTIVVKREYVSQENGVCANTNITGKKRKLKNRRVLTSNTCTNAISISNVEEVSQVKEETSRGVTGTETKVRSESGGSSDGSDLEPKKLLSTCTYCDKSFERRAALSTHLQHCSVKQSVLEHTSVYGISVCTKRSRLHSSAEKSSKETRQQIMVATAEDDPDTELLNEMFANLGRQDFGVGLRTVIIDQDDLTASGTDDAKDDEEEVKPANTSTEVIENSPADVSVAGSENTPGTTSNESTPEAKEEDMETKAGRRMRTGPMEKRLLCRCKICYKQFTALSNLRRHISMFHYRAQRFGCTLCEYRAFRRYDIVNHLCNTHGMNGDPEAMSIEFVSEQQVNYSREDVEGDIVVLDEGNDLNPLNESVENVENGNEPMANVKRLKRNKTIASSSGPSVTVSKITRQKLKRSQSQHETCTGGMKTPARRPIRNRIKPENKDFVYDLSSLVKKDNNAPQSDVTRTLRRRNTANTGSAEAVTPCIESLLGPADSREHIRGALGRLTAMVISSGAAASSTQPELPAERPQMRPRVNATQRADNHSVPVIETSDLEAARLQSTLLEDTFLGKVAKTSPTSFKIKPALSLHTSTLSWLLEKVDSSLHQNAKGKSSPSSTLCNDENGISSIHVSPPPSIPRANAPPPTPRKRITMIDRLRNETCKYRDSLLRSALED
ncbi:PREDICTED: uncharacterized protein LOC108358186 isoform X1 [Rhagoletis zephyria]|uniref:uncharacterized protein LOC108358186 isoform X1 n=2 Tax=Rhagoletis zephyria TaxID=28612 RepID=UPI000811421D|nr:PREDICTED: uncharacterized protein LOC108358186 isoform X1 [Rhagoletis zephyria]